MAETTTAAALGAAHELEHGGRLCRFRLIAQEDKAAYQRWLERNARKAAMDLRGEVPDEAWKAAWNSTVADIAAKAYRFHGDHATRAPQTFGGMVGLMAILGTVDGPDGKARPLAEDEMLDVALERGDEVAAIMNAIFEESFPNLIRAARERAAKATPPTTPPAPEGGPTP